MDAEIVSYIERIQTYYIPRELWQNQRHIVTRWLKLEYEKVQGDGYEPDEIRESSKPIESTRVILTTHKYVKIEVVKYVFHSKIMDRDEAMVAGIDYNKENKNV